MADAWGISWRSLFRVWESREQSVPATVGTYGAPFLDHQLSLGEPLDFIHKMNRDVLCAIRSPRIDANGEQ
jgi:hypothetical protein